MLLKEVILENFMSYEYARIPLKPGLNLICGPNGAGKSSILLAISVALGQAYTERSRKLSDLIRWGKDIARVTLFFDNSPKGGKRPLPKYDTDTFQLSRYLKRDGTYWYEAENRSITKEDVMKLLSEFGINSDNMLIIMHQNMVEEFSITSPQQKLKMLEDAVGFQPYRQKILEAQEKLTRLLSEEASISHFLENAEQTLTYWKEEYARYLRKKELLEKKAFLEKELAWAQVIKQEKIADAWKTKIQRKTNELTRMTKELEETRDKVKNLQDKLKNLQFNQKKLFYSLLEAEKLKTEAEVTNTILTRVLSNIGSDEDTLKKLNLKIQSYLKEASFQLELSNAKKYEAEDKIQGIQSKLGETEEEANSTLEQYLKERVKEALLVFQKEKLEDEIAELKSELKETEKELSLITSAAEKIGPRVETQRNPLEVSEEIKITNAHLMSLGEVSEDTEKMYVNYSNMYTELKQKAAIVAENRKRALKEIEDRKQTWKRVLQDLLDKVNPVYQKILSKIEATGRVRLVNTEDIETAGLELLVGFRGAAPTVLDAYTQSGGERSAATMAFLLALQQHVKSPIRAIDEFDVHMDPRNREVISQLLISAVQDNEVQHIAITPSQITQLGKEVHVITVQNIQGKSETKVVTKTAK
ncbi:AAA family ATPase [Candidatus Bathyarchaeota archaeon]|nr:AAA family ATPase [Candidatus Bathyarchaeota archaeon]